MRIAICDDVKTERQNVIDVLRVILKSFSVNEFSEGAELLKSHVLLPYDLIILDILMPGLNGIQTAAALRKTDTKTPIIFLSSSEEFGVESYRVLAFDYLLKPIDRTQLTACLKRLTMQRKKKHYVTVTYAGVETKILLSNIQCLESNLRKVIFTLLENKKIEIEVFAILGDIHKGDTLGKLSLYDEDKETTKTGFKACKDIRKECFEKIIS